MLTISEKVNYSKDIESRSEDTQSRKSSTECKIIITKHIPMTQTRIVLSPKYKDKAEEILMQTGIESLSQLFSIFVVSYGDRLIASIKGQKS